MSMSISEIASGSGSPTVPPSLVDGLARTRRITPIIVCGAARSGTRMAADLLNIHDRIAVQNEMFAEVWESYLRMLADIDRTFSEHESRNGKKIDVHWRNLKGGLTHAFFAAACKKRGTGQGKDLRFHGIKTPGFERYFVQFEKIFSKHPPLYVYCLRSAGKVWRSWHSLGYLDSVSDFRRRYERSLRQAGKIKRRAGDRFILFDLDAFVSATDKHEHLKEQLFLPMGLKVGRRYKNLFNHAPNRNSMKRFGVESKRDERVELEMRELDEHPGILELRKKLGASENAPGRKA